MKNLVRYTLILHCLYAQISMLQAQAAGTCPQEYISSIKERLREGKTIENLIKQTQADIQNFTQAVASADNEAEKARKTNPANVNFWKYTRKQRQQALDDKKIKLTCLQQFAQTAPETNSPKK